MHANPLTPETEALAADAGTPPPNHHRLLIIDDTRAIHDDFRKILSRHEDACSSIDCTEAALFDTTVAFPNRKEFLVDSAYQGQEGLARLQHALAEGVRYEVAFVDVRMPPGWDGVETIARLWAADPDLQVVICTAHSDYSWDQITGHLGHSDRLVILKKPFDAVEVLQLANALTEKWRLLQETRGNVERLETLVKERTLRLQHTIDQLAIEIAQRKRREHCLTLQQEVTGLLADTAATVDEVANGVLRVLCKGMAWDVGTLWTVEHSVGALRCATTWHQPGRRFEPFTPLSRNMTIALGFGLAGRVWAEGKPAWVSDLLQEEARCLRSAAANQIGLRSGFAFPLRLRGEILGVVEFLSSDIRPPEEDILQLFATLGSVIGQSVEHRRLEEQLRQSQKLDAIGRLAGGVAHDFNNMLTIIQGYARLLLDRQNQGSDGAEYLNQIFLAAEKSANLTRQLLTFGHKRVMQPKTLDVNSVVTSLGKMLRRIVGEDVVLQMNCSPQPAVIHADEDMMGQVIMNLVVNARDAMPAGGTLCITTEIVNLDAVAANYTEACTPGEFVCLMIRDTGCGIAPEVLPHIFEPFFTTKGVGRGTGLGLATVHGIVRQHKGWIDVASQPGAGATFRVYLPRHVSDVTPTPKAVPEAQLKGGDETILLVEDEDQVRTLTKACLERLGYRVLEADSGSAALTVWERERSIHLLLTDIVMPGGMNGRDLAQRLVAEQPELPVILMSGYDPDSARAAVPGHKSELLLQKPCPLDKLAHAIRDSLDSKLPLPQERA